MNIYKKIIDYVPEKKKELIGAISCSGVSTVLKIVAFWYLYQFVQEVVIKNDIQDAKKSILYMAGFLVLSSVLYFISLLFSHAFGFRLETKLRQHGIDGLTQSSFRFFDKNSSGKIRKILDDNAAQTHMAVAHLIPDNIGAILLPILLFVLSFWISVRLGYAMIVLAIFSVICLYGMMGDRNFFKTYQEALERLSSETVEYVRGMQVVKIFGIDVRSFTALNHAIKQYGNYAMEYSKTCKRAYVSFQTVFIGVIGIAIPIILLFFSEQLSSQTLVVELVLFFFLSGLFFGYTMKVMYLFMHIYEAQNAIEKLELLYDEMKEERLHFGTCNQMEHYNITFENVSFGYNETMVLDGLNFQLEEGKSYALVGGSGSGKSTIAKLISGFYSVQGGTIKIGGVPIEQYSEQTLIENIAFVFQNVQLFKTTLYENVKIAKENATKEEVLQAMKLAGCDSILNKFATREETVIGAKGVYLSGGEKQRIGIARAILKNANIIIFDEASASIDPDNEYELQKAFANLIKGKTVIMIAHRLSSIRNVDEILVLENGTIIERGSDKELMQENTKYRYFQEQYKKANDWRVSYE